MMKDHSFKRTVKSKELSDSDESSSGDLGGGASHVTDTSGSGESSSKSMQLTKKETEAVFRLRVLVVLVLMLTALAVSLTVFFVTKNGESEEFKTQYEGAAQKIQESFRDIVHEMGAISGLGLAESAHSVDHTASWPYVTLSNFQQRAGNARHLSGALLVTIAPRVSDDDFDTWNDFVHGPDSSWIDEGLAYQELLGLNDFQSEANIEKSRLTDLKVDPMHYFDIEGNVHLEDEPAYYYLPIWQTSPVLKTSLVNENMLRRLNVSVPQSEIAAIVIEEENAVIGGYIAANPGTADDPNPKTALFATLRSFAERKPVPYLGDPMANVYIPVFDRFNHTSRRAVAVMTAVVHWRSYFRKILPNNVNGIDIVLENSCDGSFSYNIRGPEAFVVGFGDHHDTKFNDYRRDAVFEATKLSDGTVAGIGLHKRGCQYSLHIYPSQMFYDQYKTSTPLVITFAIVAVFIFTIFMFLFYDRLVERRQKIVLAKATQSTAIVSSLFPKQVRDRLLEGDTSALGLGTKTRLKGFLEGDAKETENNTSTIADLFPHCTVFFADIAGFTAWSSTREPAQVFILLQTVYQAFDALAKRRKVFKVETIGDSYMAVTGLPEPQENHALIMVRFAWDCMVKMNEVVKGLEVSLGPDTGELSMRFGLHSGPVTAGVLRGDRARFQLFGDTVNTASRMESTGARKKIHVSQTTAALIRDAGKDHWLRPRLDSVKAKGKGVLDTFWVNPSSKRGSSDASGESSTGQIDLLKEEEFKPVNERLVDWMAELLQDNIKKVIFARRQCKVKEQASSPISYQPDEGVTCLDEVQNVIKMPKFNAKNAATSNEYKLVEIDQAVLESLKDYVASIAAMYRNNPFHNFEHACHVTMSVTKLLRRIVAPDLSSEQLEKMKRVDDLASHLHDYTHGINSDPLLSLAITFSALIHDVDHRGVSNMQLITEVPELGVRYRNKSVAEQNSLDVAWDILMEERFSNLRCTLFPSKDELMRFRQLIVNVVLATDIFDKELNDLRKERWTKAFSEDVDNVDSDLRATIVIEHIIQASDVSHTMQHWHVYQKWNKCLFMEMYKAFQEGRLAKDPSTFWYTGEIGFFDNYIIPLAKKLKDCGVFGVSSDEYLNYATLNRDEWAERGEEIVKELVATLAK